MENEHLFEIVSKFKPTGDQPTAIKKLSDGILNGKKFQVLMGATGTGKTFTMANIIQTVQKPTLVLVHNKTLAGQLYSEFQELFPHNRVEYFVSNFDFYQPEAYIPKSDTYIDKNAVMNEEIEMLRTSAINSVLERKDTIIVASVASIYGLTDPDEYRNLVFNIRVGEEINRQELYKKLVDAQYKRNNLDLAPGTFRVRGDVIEIVPASFQDNDVIRIDTFGDEVEKIVQINQMTGEIKHTYHTFPIFPAYDHASTRERIKEACVTIKAELEERLKFFKENGKLLEAERLEMRTNQDMESMQEFGMMAVGKGLVTGIIDLVNNILKIVNYSGVQMLIFLAGLQSISPAIYEAARIDGASAWETFWKITFPMISPMILVNGIYTIIDSFTRQNNPVMTYIERVYDSDQSQATAEYWVYFMIVFAIVAAFAGIVSAYVFYQRRD